jgi:hypothetical protein
MEARAEDFADQLFGTAIITFRNMLRRDSRIDSPEKTRRLHGRMLEVITQVSTLKDNNPNFVYPNSLTWLNGLKWDLLGEYKLGFDSNTPIGALNSWLLTTASLEVEQVKDIIISGILQSSQVNGAPDVIKFIKSLSPEHKALLGPRQEHPVRILVRMLEDIVETQNGNLRANANYWDGRVQALFGARSFDEWKLDLDTLIVDLRRYDSQGVI